MCGGRGSRLDADREKPLVRVCGDPMVERVRRALAGSSVATVHAAVSPHTPDTRQFLTERDVRLVETPGEGYLADLDAALDAVGRPAVTVVADLPLLAPGHVDRAVAAARGRNGETSNADTDGEDAAAAVDSVAVCVPATLKRRLGASVDASFAVDGRELAPTGLNVVAGGSDEHLVSRDPRLAVNVNRPADRDLAEERCP